MARPAFTATDDERKLVEALVAYGIKQEHIVLRILRPFGKDRIPKPISLPTLRKHFEVELASAEPTFLAAVADSLGKTALDRKHPGHVAAAIFIMKARAGWQERVRHDHAGRIDLDLDLAGASEEELAVLERFIGRKAREFAPANDRAA